ncbi:two-component system KDP operon response regulator KdpE [Arthrobacter sp. PvP102]|jgi:two-component system KDP operon response regulator KdpE|uniref:response regulator n=1 Tax=unclassified Arthrobacter TaxID=235627 RepID=UPI0000526A3E|nr:MULTISPECIES: response regulator [unclassified Arthrobacter]ABK03264.1 two component transcriptional regulator, winged helix family [Arthrobacter sp. FB24]MBP1235334.1 two-component system KDP operon response regulator KdpE [Arthrobacter sp. PvP103]MBP1236293.1 two-component system KDP operon response regulator KdpE [Arthrobacter sp. PvP102]
MTAVLVVDDDPLLLKVLKITLQANGYSVTTATDGKSALLAATQHPLRLIVLDLGLPDIDGTTVITELRRWNPVPILVLSARHGSEDKVEALDAGADDYITKPFGPDELLARLRALLRRASDHSQDSVVTTGAFTVDLGKHRVTREGNDVRLTPTEWNILELMVRNPDKLITQRQLLSEVWGPAYTTDSNYLRVYMAQLRRKLEPKPGTPRHFLTEPGVGYRFQP